jgi:DNA modification methylase
MTEWQNRIVGYRVVKASELAPNDKNWRKHPKRQKDALTDVLDKIGWVDTVLYNVRTGRLIDGHLRQSLNPDVDVPVLDVDLSEEEEMLVLATFDPIGAMAEADKAALEGLLSALSKEDETLAGLLSAIAEDNAIQMAGSGGVVDAPPQIDKAGELRELWQTERGQVWVIDGKHRVMCGDSTQADDVARLMDGKKADLMVTSPPYNQNLETFSKSGMHKSNSFVDRMAQSYFDSLPEDEYQLNQIVMLELWKSVMSQNGSIFYNHKLRYRDKKIVSPLEWLIKLSFPIRQEIIWDRGGSVTLNARMFMPCDERIYWLRVGDDFIFNDTTDIKTWSTVWRIAPKNDVSISAAFASEIPTRCILACSLNNSAVVDPYLGSGTTLIACAQTGRVCYGMEIAPEYVAVILQRAKDAGMSCVLSHSTN